ncbi:MAG: hypothetical protein M3Q44_08400 [bacterium]|nr:hypothetical protein [bacterium]
MRKFIVVSAFLISTPLVILLLFISISYGVSGNKKEPLAFLSSSSAYRLFKSIPSFGSDEVVVGTKTSKDARAALVRRFFKGYNSPLEKLSDYIVFQADTYAIDYRLIPAISMQESTGCKFIPENSYNCWGYGIYGDKVLRFVSYEEGIERVSRGLRKDYYDKGLNTPIQIMAKYTPPSIALGGPWAHGIYYFFNEIENPD